MFEASSEFERFNAQHHFKRTLILFLNQPNAHKFDFNTIPYLSTLISSNRQIFIFTWVVPKSNYTYENFGIVYFYDEKKKKYDIVELTDVKYEINNIDKKELRKNQWWGCLYYELIEVQVNNNKYYTLLGWDGSEQLVNKKVIDVLRISPNSGIVFGAPIFSGYGRQLKRVIFQYAKNATMNLRYERQSYEIVVKSKNNPRYKNPKQRNNQQTDGFRAQQPPRENVKTKRTFAQMIVFDNIIPLNQNLKDVYAYYVPEVNVVNSFIFRNNRWEFIEDIDARNKPSNKDHYKPSTPISKIPPVPR